MSKTIIIRNLELHYSRLNKPHAPFGSDIWEVQARTTDSATVEQLKAAGANVKEKDGYFYAALKRNVKNRKGEDNKPVVLVDAEKQPMDPNIAIGNGSTANVKVFSYDWQNMGRSGTSCMLSAVQITNFIEYKGSDDVDFDVESAEGF